MKSPQSGPFTIERDCDAYTAEIANVVEAAFRAEYGNGDGEVALIAALREAHAVATEFVAVEEGAIVGHAMFSWMSVEPALCKVAALAPVCARVGRQRSGIGSALIRTGFEACREQGIGALIVLGDTDYYGRFGFSAAKAAAMACAFAGPHLQALELVPGALNGVRSVAYAPAFLAV